MTSCPRCDGIGVVIQNLGFFEAKVVACPKCSGTGVVSPGWFRVLFHRLQLWLEGVVGRS